MASKYKKCALAAAYSAATGTDVEVDSSTVHGTLKEKYPVGKIMVGCPVDGCKHSKTPIVDLIPHLNDNEGWTRQRIAEWVKGYEDLMMENSKGKAVSNAAKIVEEACKNMKCKEEEPKEKVLVKRK